MTTSIADTQSPMALEDDGVTNSLEREKMKREKMDRKTKDFEDQSSSFHIYLGDIPIRRQNGREGVIKKLYKDISQKQRT